MASDILHSAARDGFIDRLREVTRKECNAPDEDGMTPTLWTAHAGKLEALRHLVGRGGDPDKCDHYGNTALHVAARNGHHNVVIFLISFGVNLWAQDNDHHTAKEVAGAHGYDEVMRALDHAASKQQSLNPKKVMSYKEKAVTDVEKRLKKLEKLHKQAEKKALKEHVKMQKGEASMVEQGGETQSSMLHRDSMAVYASQQFSDIINRNGNTKKKSVIGGAVLKKIGRAKGQNANNKSKTVSSADFKVTVVEDGKHTVKSLTGLRRDSEVLYTGKIDERTKAKDIFDESSETKKQLINKALSSPDVMDDPRMQLLVHQRNASIFERPGFGNVAFRHRPASIVAIVDDNDSRGSDTSESIGSAGSLALRNKGNTERPPWTEEEINMEEDANEYHNPSPIEVFLVTHHLRSLRSTFIREDIDLEALMLLNENDLMQMGLLVGPRKKLMDAINRRKAALDDSGEVFDSRL